MNSNGGTIFFGVNDEGYVNGQNISSKEKDIIKVSLDNNLKRWGGTTNNRNYQNIGLMILNSYRIEFVPIIVIDDVVGYEYKNLYVIRINVKILKNNNNQRIWSMTGKQHSFIKLNASIQETNLEKLITTSNLSSNKHKKIMDLDDILLDDNNNNNNNNNNIKRCVNCGKNKNLTQNSYCKDFICSICIFKLIKKYLMNQEFPLCYCGKVIDTSIINKNIGRFDTSSNIETNWVILNIDGEWN